MPSNYSILKRLDDLEATVVTLAKTATVNLQINTLTDEIGALLLEISGIQQQLQTVQLPNDTRYYLSQNEIDFIRQGMADISKLVVELEALKDSLLRLNHKAL